MGSFGLLFVLVDLLDTIFFSVVPDFADMKTSSE